MKWPGIIQFKVWRVTGFVGLYMYIKHYYIIALHYDALPSTVHPAVKQHFMLCSIRLRVTSTKLTQCTTLPGHMGTKHHTHPLTLQQSRATHFSNCGWRTIVLLTIHTLTQACVCLQTEDTLLGVFQWCDDGACRGFRRQLKRRVSFGGVADFAGWCVLNVVRCLMLFHPLLVVACYCWSCDVCVI